MVQDPSAILVECDTDSLDLKLQYMAKHCQMSCCYRAQLQWKGSCILKKNVIFIKNETKDFCFHSRFFIFTLVNFFTGPENVLRSYFKSPLPLLNPWLCPSPQLHILSTRSNSWCWIISSPVYCKLSSMEYFPKEVCISCIHAILNSIL